MTVLPMNRTGSLPNPACVELPRLPPLMVTLLLLLMSVASWVVILWKAWLLRRASADIRRGIAAFWQGCFDMGLAAMVRTPSTIDWPCDSANEVGDYHLRNRQGQLVDVGKYVTVWKAHQGQWQIQCDRWTSNLPEPFAKGEWFDSKG